MAEFPGITQFQVVQETKKDISIKIKNNRHWRSENESKIIHQFKKDIGSETQIQIELTDKIEREKSGKFKIVKSEVQ